MLPKASKCVCFSKAAKQTNECKCQTWLWKASKSTEPICQNQPKFPGKSHKIQNSQKMLKLKWKLKVRKSLGKTWKNGQISAKYLLRPILRKLKIGKMKNPRVPPLFKIILLKLNVRNLAEAIFLKIQKTNLPNFTKNARKTEYELQPILRKSKKAKIKKAVVLFPF